MRVFTNILFKRIPQRIGKYTYDFVFFVHVKQDPMMQNLGNERQHTSDV